MALNCCAADAQPVKIGLSGRIPPVLQPDTWLEVTGTYSGRRTKDPVNGGVIPFLRRGRRPAGAGAPRPLRRELEQLTGPRRTPPGVPCAPAAPAGTRSGQEPSSGR